MTTRRKQLRRLLLAFVAVIIALTVIVPFQAGAAWVGATEISSQGAVVLDFETGIVLYGYKEGVNRVPASMIKVLAAYVVYDAISEGLIGMDTNVLISPEISRFSNNRTYSNVILPEGSSVTIRELLEVVLIRSACAATVAMGEAIYGSEESFIDQMSAKAAQLGVELSIYDSWGGSPKNSISPLGMAVITREFILEHPGVLEITAKRNVTFRGVTYNSSNLLLGDYSGLDGFKTGYTDPAGYCFVGTARQGGRRVVTVTMGSTLRARYPDTRALLNYGFMYLKTRVLPSRANLVLDGASAPLSAYLIDGNHYFKLRDIAKMLEGTAKKFDVNWNQQDNTISISSGMQYTSVGGELEIASNRFRLYTPTVSKIYFDGEECVLNAYYLEGNNFFRLRDIATLVDFGVDWDNETMTVLIDTSSGYEEQPANAA